MTARPPTPQNLTLIFNPAAGRGQARRCHASLQNSLAQKAQAYGTRCQLLETTSPGEATFLAAQAAKEGCDLIVAAGGDGTLGEVVNGLAQSNYTSVLGILPFGTGNDFARCLGIGTDWQKALNVLFEGTTRRVDVGHALFEDTGARHLFINVAGCGFDALVAQHVNDFRFHRLWRHVRGVPAYLSAVGQELLKLRAVDLSLECDGQVIQQRAMLCAVANATSYGGGMLVAPDARFDDGEFDICLIKEAGQMEFLRAFPRVFKGTHTSHSKVQMLRGREISLRSEPPLPVLIDGEVRGKTPVRFWLEPRILKVQAPCEE
jgi:diacylglycerol kinase (ATP)